MEKYYKTELHVYSKPVSSCSEIETKYLVNIYKENNLIATCGSDFRHYGQECLCGILTKKPLLDSYDVAEVLKKREYLMSIGGYTVSL